MAIPKDGPVPAPVEGGHWRPEPDQVDTDTYTAEPGHQEVLVVGAGAHRAVLNIVEVSANQENHHHLAMAISS